MAPSKQPKVLLFDIGGVCVLSPMQAILDYELSNNVPPGWVNNCISKTAPKGFWHRLERGELPMDSTWFAGFTSELHNASLWKDFYSRARTTNPSLPPETPPVPAIDGEALFWSMMGGSREPDPWMYPALQRLRASGHYILAALSNTVIFPPSHPYNDSHASLKCLFDIFISSAHVGLRKPDPAIYTLALTTISSFAKANANATVPEMQGRNRQGWNDGVRADEIVFLDDIGENLKAARKVGFGTIKVGLGRAFEAVDKLEELTGLQLAGKHPRVAIVPVVKARL